MIFSSKVTVADDGSSITVDGVTISPGNAFESGETKELPPTTCGGKQYQKVLHQYFGGVSEGN
ncbi:hypothetical protein [Trueperella sp. LYQ143]|uniref:hypothetical protein n=1 Tax=unclassified Trueperella TaxID=2630174 RepID=UPI003982F04E